MDTKLKIGDKVRINMGFGGTICRITEIDPDGTIAAVSIATGAEYQIKPNQMHLVTLLKDDEKRA